MNLPRQRLRLLVVIVIAAVLTQIAATTSHTAPASAATRKVLWIAMENRSYVTVIGKPVVAPYLNGTLIPRGGNATNMHSETHPSLPNYIAMTTGSTRGIADDNGPAYHPVSAANLFGQVGPSWKAYQEVMPSNCSQKKNTTFTNGTMYVVRHNPATYMVAAPISAPGADCNVNDEPLGTASLGNLQQDLAGGTLPSFSFVTPGICHDMHTAPLGTACDPSNAITAGDQWLATWMPKIFSSPDYTNGALVVFLTWDEGTGGAHVNGMDCLSTQYAGDVGCHIPTLVFSTGTTGGSSDGTYFTHYSMLKTTEQLLGVSTATLGSNASGAISMRTAFNL